jgi:uncharacterized membrane protein
MLYLWLKYIHVISSTILFGTGIGTASNMFLAYRTRDVYIIAATARYVVFADWVFTATSAVVQPVTGLWMVYLAGYSLSTLWVAGSVVGYLIAACCWIPVVYLQIKMRNMAVMAVQVGTPLPQRYHRYFWFWFSLGWPAFFSLLAVFYFMTMKPG